MNRSVFPHCFVLPGLAVAAMLTSLNEVQAAPVEDRAAWTNSRMVGSPDPPAPYRVERRFPGLEFKNPLEMVAEPGSDRWWMVELEGKIWTFENDDNAANRELAARAG